MSKTALLGLLLVVSLPFIMWDCSSRVIPDIDRIEEKPETERQIKITDLNISDRHAAQILQQLEKYDVKAKPKPKQSKPVAKKPDVFIMPKALQDKQQGELVDLYAGDVKYKLVATFSNADNKAALIFSENLRSGKTNLQRLGNGASVSGYQLVGIEKGRVKLKNGERIVILQVFPSHKEKEVQSNA